MSAPTNLPELSFRYLKTTLHSTTEVFLALTLLCVPILAPLATENVTMALFGFLGVLGWAVYFGQELALERLDGKATNREDSEKKEGITETLYLVSALLYHNAIIFIGIALAVSLSQTGSPIIAIIAAFLYPVFDTFTANRKIPIPLSFGGVAAFVIWILSHLLEVLRGMSWESLGLDRFSVRFVDVFERQSRLRIP